MKAVESDSPMSSVAHFFRVSQVTIVVGHSLGDVCAAKVIGGMIEAHNVMVCGCSSWTIHLTGKNQFCGKVSHAQCFD